MQRNRIVFWLGQPSPHQSSCLRALASEVPRATVIGIFESPLKTARLELGWREPELGLLKSYVSPNNRQIDELVLTDPESSVHIFGGFQGAMIRRALARCVGTRSLIGIMSEWRPWTGWLGMARVAHSILVERRHRARVDFVLAIGHLGVRWFEMCGYSADRIFPWAYIVETTDCRGAQREPDRGCSAPVRLAFVGQCIPRKDVGTLLSALANLPQNSWDLQVVGDGPQKPSLQQIARKLGISERVHFTGIKTNSEVRGVLDQTDLLILPSRGDGWGAVVNEALMAGVPVVCSDHCGAADLIRNSDRGEIFRAGDAEQLARVLTTWIDKGRVTPQRREAIREWSRCIEGPPAAQYLVRIIEHIEGQPALRPIAPWLARQRGAELTDGD